MSEVRNVTCVVCPVGCEIQVSIEEGGESSFSGNRCKKGAAYALSECTNPVRTLTTIVRVNDERNSMLPVRSDRPLPKHLIFDCMKRIKSCKVAGPVRIGDVVCANILNTGVNIIASANSM